MEEITLKGWQLNASIVDTDVLKLDIESLDGTDIIETGYAGQGGKDGDQYAFRFTTQRIEEQFTGVRRRSSEPTDEADVDAEEDETIYLRGWEITAMVDEEGMLHLLIEKGAASDIYETDPIESNIPQSSRVTLRLAAENTDEDEDEEDDDDDDDEFEDDIDEFDELEEDDERDRYEDDYEDELLEDEEEYSRYSRSYGHDDLY